MLKSDELEHNRLAIQRVCVRDRKKSCLLLVFPVLVVLYDTFVHFDTKPKSVPCDRAVVDTTLKTIVTLMSDEGIH